MFAYLPLGVLVLGHCALWVAIYNRLHSWGIPRRLVEAGSVLVVAVLASLPAALVWLLLTGNQAEGLPVGLAALTEWPAFFGARTPPGLSKGLAALYAVVCLLKACETSFWWIRGKFAKPPEILRRLIRWPIPVPVREILSEQKSFPARWLLRVPANQSLRLEVSDIAVELPRLPASLDRLRLVQLSDCHLSGRVPRRYFEHVVDVVNELRPDFVFLTGDIVEKPHCLTWVESVFGRLEARYGAYFVLGNHERRLNVTEVRRALEAAGLIDLGGQVVEIPLSPNRPQDLPTERGLSPSQLGETGIRHPRHTEAVWGKSAALTAEFCPCPTNTFLAADAPDLLPHRGGDCLSRPTLRLYPPASEESVELDRSITAAGATSADWPTWIHWPRIVLVGNERPWWGDHPSLASLNGNRASACVIAIAHTPDQIRWARREGVDLLLAGHLHGGQIRLPGIGPIVSPSRFGTRLNAGLFYLPPTVLYVNRGLSARFPLRWNAPPEIACLTLRAPAAQHAFG